jgi:hypothetical protein
MLLADGNEFTDDDIAALRAAGLPPACDLATPL